MEVGSDENPHRARPGGQPLKHAIVVGGSMAGMAIAKALSGRFPAVTVIDRDRFQGPRHPRGGVPQSRHLHVLLARGLQVWEDLMPGTKEALVKAGAHMLKQSEFRLLYPSGWNPDAEVNLEFCACTRTLLESTVRDRLSATSSNIQFLQGLDVAGLTLEAGRVTGVRGRNGVLFPADLVVDAGGRSSHICRWLEEHGYNPPEETVIDAFWGYATRVYRPAQNVDLGWKQMFMFPRPPHLTRGGVLQPIEGGRWLMTVGGVNRDYPPLDEAGFLEFVRSLAAPDLYNALKHAEPETPVMGFRHTDNRLRHFDRTRLPDGLLVAGDSACAFNPIYGQGMTVAALEAMMLRGMLARRRSIQGLTREFQSGISKIISNPWSLATGEDLRWPGTVGAKPDRTLRFMHKYLDHVIALVPKHADVFQEFIRVQHMTAGPEALFRPSVLLKVMRRAISQRRARGRRVADVCCEMK